ncbi:prenyltransferase/squalene oxidase repeat-containing protein [Actinomadura sp. NAK00032]|uniref:prenyltransferase/squalene oxidase repeat-containing protein n=1 Tax=Actinomadura sp. NAK00032 TaxID=2742128 RepID=UPI0020C7BC10|nr:prenyltransferase/squalene oxidase repeat-containing protein [Actinomadura sp. NAK00032]
MSGTEAAGAADDLIASLVARPWGRVSPSVYETGRLVSLSPWLTGHRRRVAFLVDTQRPDGGWGAPDDGYALVPTLSATEALLSVLVRTPPESGTPEPAVCAAAVRGLRRLGTMLPGRPGAPLPDMPAIELIVPSLAGLIDRRVADLAARPAPPPGLPDGPLPLPLPRGMDGRKLTLVRDLLASGAQPPQKLMHALEIAGPAARGLAQARPEATGTIGASPAATAAWLGDRPPAEPSSPARWYLETVTAMHDGAVPVAYPLTVFERGWVLSWLIRAGVPVTVPPEMVLSLTAPIRADGTPAADGLPPDADTTAAALHALALLGVPHKPDSLWNFETPTHFCTWQGEDGFSVTTNAHVLEAFGEFTASRSAGSADIGDGRHEAAAGKVADWLLGRQRDDGAWTDRWHASPYYATACCALALDRYGGRPRSADAVDRAVKWVLESQRPDGSWGRWEGTAEETAYAVQTLLLPAVTAGREPGRDLVRAAARGRGVLLRGLALPDRAHPPMWHDKDLYHPGAIVRAAVLAALHLLDAVAPDRGKE